MRRLALTLTLLMLGAPGALGQPVISARDSTAFPHERHAKLFALCESCHVGITSGDAATMYPPPASCGSCHNGTDTKVVAEWRPPVRSAGLLRYSHVQHATKVDSAGRVCGSCHGSPDRPLMAVHAATPESCITCHTHRASTHLADDNRCGSCHVALTAATGLSREQIAAFPQPPSHARAHYVANHAPVTGELARTCATCHARESCARCHVNATTQPIIAALATDARVAAIVASKEAVYPTPADHGTDEFEWGHGDLARAAVARCAACHTRSSCTTCHTGPGGVDLIRQLPNAERGGPPGVRLELRRTPQPRVPELNGGEKQSSQNGVAKKVRVHEPGFLIGHRAQAGAEALTCAGCHAQRFCSDCHNAEPSQPRLFHAANFAMSHAASAYGREVDCATCHNAEAFCRDCHAQSGLASSGRLNVAYHTAQPLWLLQHGRAARQGLQNCTSCHVQKDCMRCHSTLGWGISPHGPGFDAKREANRAPVMCLACHVEVPGRPPR